MIQVHAKIIAPSYILAWYRWTRYTWSLLGISLKSVYTRQKLPDTAKITDQLWNERQRLGPCNWEPSFSWDPDFIQETMQSKRHSLLLKSWLFLEWRMTKYPRVNTQRTLSLFVQPIQFYAIYQHRTKPRYTSATLLWTALNMAFSLCTLSVQWPPQYTEGENTLYTRKYKIVKFRRYQIKLFGNWVLSLWHSVWLPYYTICLKKLYDTSNSLNFLVIHGALDSSHEKQLTGRLRQWQPLVHVS